MCSKKSKKTALLWLNLEQALQSYISAGYIEISDVAF